MISRRAAAFEGRVFSRRSLHAARTSQISVDCSHVLSLDLSLIHDKIKKTVYTEGLPREEWLTVLHADAHSIVP